MKINLVRSLFTFIATLLILMLLFRTRVQAQPTGSVEVLPKAREDSTTGKRFPLNQSKAGSHKRFFKVFSATLNSGVWQKMCWARHLSTAAMWSM
jgi:hypothetical protein